MRINPTRFHQLNVADTCAVWNVLSSQLLYARALAARCSFCCTRFVVYECLHKKRKSDSIEDTELQRRLRDETKKGRFSCHELDLEDLQDVQILESRKRLSLGELSSIAFAKKTQQAFMTDDQGARYLAESQMSIDRVQTTPQLFGWLLFIGVLQDADKNEIVGQHTAMKRPLGRYFEEMYSWSLEQRLARGGGPGG